MRTKLNWKKCLALCLCLLVAVSAVHVGTTVDAQAATKKNGIVKIDNQKYYYKNGKKKTGWVTIKSGSAKGKYYFNKKKKGAAAAGLTKISKKQYYFNKKTNKLVTNKYGIKIGKKYYQINKKGVATKVSEVNGLAGVQLDKCKGKLKKAFIWSADLKYYSGVELDKNAKYFATYGFRYNKGDCNVQAATFYMMAKVLGKNATFKKGYIKKRLADEDFSAHAWVEIDGKVYDPNFAQWLMMSEIYKKTKSEAVDIAYGFAYGDGGHFHYYDYDKNIIGE